MKSSRFLRWNRLTLMTLGVVTITAGSLLQSSIFLGYGASNQPLQMVVMSPHFVPQSSASSGEQSQASALSVDVDIHGHLVHTVIGGSGCAHVVKALGDYVRTFVRCSVRGACRSSFIIHRSSFFVLRSSFFVLRTSHIAHR
jgi:hypothetical protein